MEKAEAPNPNHPNSKQNLFGHFKFEFEVYLGFGVCILGFKRYAFSPLVYELNLYGSGPKGRLFYH
jgi:hypothetical protein